MSGPGSVLYAVRSASVGDSRAARIAGSEVDTLLEPFRRASGRLSRPGHGLGLSIVAAIAAAHNAELSVQARADGGLDVAVTFPPVPPGPATNRGGRATGRNPVAEIEELV
jgi:K+-sensing histidine kinase KdpD